MPQRDTKGCLTVDTPLGSFVWNGRDMVACQPHATEDQLRALGGIPLTEKEAERVASSWSGCNITFEADPRAN